MSMSDRVSPGNALFRLVMLLIGALLALAILVVGFYEGRKAYWDWKTAQLCEAEGGVIINERIRILPEQQAALPGAGGRLAISPKSLAAPNSPAFFISQETTIRDKLPRIVRMDHMVIRRADGKAVGRITRYIRIGGDFPTGIAHDSHFMCPDSEVINERQSEFFQIEGASR